MTARVTVDIWCDWPECYAKADTYFRKISDARDWSARQGWKRLSGGLDVCGRPDQADEYSSQGQHWKGHADRTDHAPIVEPSRKGYVRLTCSCGWKHVAEYTWQPEGSVPTGSVHLYWGKHIKEAEAGAGQGTGT